MFEQLLKLNPGRKFIFAMFTVTMVTIFWGIMKYDAATYKDLIVGVAALFLASQAAVDWKNKQPPVITP